jgi:hypothetical protein
MSPSSSLGAVSIGSMDGATDEEIQSTLADDESVLRTYLRIGKRDRKQFHLETLFLKFEVFTLHSIIIVGYGRVNIWPYILNSVLCIDCQRCGHTQ